MMVGGSSGPRPGRAPTTQAVHAERTTTGVTGDDDLVARPRIGASWRLEPAERDAGRRRAAGHVGVGGPLGANRRMPSSVRRDDVEPRAAAEHVRVGDDDARSQDGAGPPQRLALADSTSTVASGRRLLGGRRPLLVTDAPSTATCAADLGATSTAKDQTDRHPDRRDRGVDQRPLLQLNPRSRFPKRIRHSRELYLTAPLMSFRCHPVA